MASYGGKIIDGELTVNLSTNDGSTAVEIKNSSESVVAKITSNGDMICLGILVENFRGDIQ